MYSLPDLPYDYSALEPHIDARTMEIHHSKHHKGYVDKTNTALEGTDWAEKPIEEVIANLNKIPKEKQATVANVGGGHVNHSFFWKVMSPPSTSSGQALGGGEPTGKVADAINNAFGDFSSFKEKFTTAAATLFGSGWAWLVMEDGKLKVERTINQASPLTKGQTPLLCVDVWEHAYYLKYQNKRPDYIEAFWNVINWEEVGRKFSETA